MALYQLFCPQTLPGETVSFLGCVQRALCGRLERDRNCQFEGYDWKEIGGRMSVFEDAALTLSIFRHGAKAYRDSKTESELGVAGGPGNGSAACQA